MLSNKYFVPFGNAISPSNGRGMLIIGMQGELHFLSISVPTNGRHGHQPASFVFLLTLTEIVKGNWETRLHGLRHFIFFVRMWYSRVGVKT